MAKKKARAGKKAGKRGKGKKGKKVNAKKKAAKAAELRKTLGLTRAKLHKDAAELADFHGGKAPVRSGCGRPRKKR